MKSSPCFPLLSPLYVFFQKSKPIALLAVAFFLSSNLQAVEPTMASHTPTFSGIQGNRMTIGWTKGNGARRIVVVKAGSAVINVPVDGTDYNPNVTFGSGDDLGGGEYVVYDGNSSSATVVNLAHSTEYHFAVFEYNGTGSSTDYLTTSFLAASQFTLSPPTTQATITTGTVTGSRIDLSFPAGNGQNRIVLAKEGSPVDANPVDFTPYTPSSGFGSGSQIGTGNYVVANGNVTSTTVVNMDINTTYHFAVFEYNGSSTGSVYLSPGNTANGTTSGPPTTAASSMSFFNIEGDQIGVSCTRGNGLRRIFVMKQGGAVANTPSNGTTYSASSNFGTGTDLGGGEYVIYDGTGSSVLATGLVHSSTYHIAIFEYDGTGSSTQYLTSSFLAGNATTVSPPTSQASGLNFTNVTGNNMTLNWTKGDGLRRLVVMKGGSAVNVDPTQYQGYNSDPSSPFLYQTGADNHVVYNGTGTSVTVTGLSPGVAYHFAVYEHNDNVYLYPGAVANETSLPIELINFKTAITPTNISLEWQTASETNNKGFEIQSAAGHLQPGVLDWKNIGFVDGHGNTQDAQQYYFTVSPRRDGIYYFRLKQIDFDGGFEYSPVRSVEWKNGGAISGINIFPNPFSENISFQTPFEDGFFDVGIFDLNGKKVFSEKYISQENNAAIELGLKNITDGIYFIKINNGRAFFYEKIMKCSGSK
ncbi:MAG TPA: T9SS type A sorting domain-containing protein [Bacteroidetes bacterium]|nr:T9SS type A sorting domain-containing protein [Bacteroidota bacterium]